MDEEFNKNHSPKQLTSNKFYDIIQSVKDLTGIERYYSNNLLLIRNLVFQQHYLQFGFDKAQLGRQKILFSEVPENHLFKREFKKITGLSIKVFLELSLAIVSRYILHNTPKISNSWFGELRKIYNEKIDLFCDLLSRGFEDLRIELFTDIEKKVRLSDLYEETPFVRFPLIKRESDYICVYPQILFRSIEYYIYDTLRSWNAQKFMDKFGSKFEDYINKGLKYSGVQYLREKELDEILSQEGKVTDFLICEKNANIFIEAKAVEMNRLGKVTNSTKVIQDKVKNSILEAIVQFHETVERLIYTNTNNLKIQKMENNYLIVVTFKEMYLFNGKNFYDNIAGNKLDKLLFKYHKNSINIPFENIYFITISDFDYLVEMVKQKKITFSKSLEKAKRDDNNPKTMKFVFSMHLTSWEKRLELPKYLSEASEFFFEKLSDMLHN